MYLKRSNFSKFVPALVETRIMVHTTKVFVLIAMMATLVKRLETTLVKPYSS